MILLKFENN